MNPARNSIIRKTALETLSYAHGFALPEGTLKSQVDVVLRPPVSEDEWQVSLNWMQINRLIVQVPSDLDEELVQFAITEQGRVKLATI